MASDSKPGCISGDKLCELTGLVDRRHRQLAAEGYFPPPSGGQYQFKPTLIGLFRFYRDQLHKKEDTLNAERKKYTVARREKTEVERDILKGKFVLRTEIGPVLRNIGSQQRAQLQNKLENELPVRLAGLDPVEIRKRMSEAVDELCRIFHDATTEWTQPKP